MSFGRTASRCHKCRTEWVTGCVQKHVCAECKAQGCEDSLQCQKCEVESQAKIIDGLLEEIEKLKDERRQKESILGMLRDTKMKHGTCQPRSRKACTACNAQEELDKIVAAWKGFTMELS